MAFVKQMLVALSTHFVLKFSYNSLIDMNNGGNGLFIFLDLKPKIFLTALFLDNINNIITVINVS